MTLYWDIVPGEVCNFRCLTCYVANNARPDHRILDFSDMKKAIDKVIDLGIRDIYLLGGEPLLYKDLERFIEYFKSKTDKGFLGIVTNGSLITTEKARSLKSAGLDLFNISIDGTTPEVNDLNRGKGTFNLIMQGIENSKAVGIPFVIGYTITPFNTADAYNVFPFVQDIGALALAVQITEQSGRAQLYFKNWDYVEGLKAICRMYRYKPPFYVTITPKKLFANFLNFFFNAGLNLNDTKANCNGGLTMGMVSSGGDFFPCAEYAYSQGKTVVRKGVNLVSDDAETVKLFVSKNFVEFNSRMRNLGRVEFTTCKSCQYNESCSPCPLTTPSGKVPECEWVKEQSVNLRRKILNSKIKLLKQPIFEDSHRCSFEVSMQEHSLTVPMPRDDFLKLVSLTEVSTILRHFKDKHSSDSEIEDKVIKFLCKLRSYGIIEISNFSIE